MFFFAFGIDPLIIYLEKRLTGILIHSMPVIGPRNEKSTAVEPIEERYKICGYADDLKPAVTSLEEITLVDKASYLFECSSGCKLHRDPAAGKCKLLPLGKWRLTLTQDDIPVNYIVLSDHLDMVGVELSSIFIQTRKVNCDRVIEKVTKTIGPWKGDKFMPITQRAFSVNTFVLSKVWFQCTSLDLRVSDIKSITSLVKSWIYQDQLEKPKELVLFRPPSMGGLGLQHIKYKALSSLI